MQHASPEIGALIPAESDLLGALFYDAVHEGAASHYTERQRQAWAPQAPSGPDWAARLMGQTTLVARIAGQPAGFMTLANDSYIDLAFVAPRHQRQGIGTALHTRIEALARAAGTARLHSEASHLARGLFMRQGWIVVREQRIGRLGVSLTNFVMEKDLRAPAPTTR